ncbi:MAG: MMPL family transporter, partial [Haloarculaceae archaeon]
MSRFRRFVDVVLDHSRVVIAVMLLLTVAVGAGASAVEQSSSLEQFQSDSPEGDALDYIESNFTTGAENTTTSQVIVRDENVLDRESLVGIIEYQQRLRENRTVNSTLAPESPTVSIANVLATAAIRGEEARDVRAVATELQQLNATVTEERQALAARNRTLSRTAKLLRAELGALRAAPNASVDAAFADVRANTTVELNETDAATFREAATALRRATSEAEAKQAYKLGTRGVLADEYRALEQRSAALSEKATRLKQLASELERERADLRNATNATLAQQRAKLESMNESELSSVVTAVLGNDGGNGGVFRFMPTDYEVGSTSADATMMVVTQQVETQTIQSMASEDITEAQLAMDALAGSAGGGEYVVFGAGVISEEIDNSMTDSLLIVGPLALVFVLLALAVGYRDVLDILLGLFGIGVVLVWTFGFMGWAGIAFNQIFIAVPVLLIGLSIDYAIHIFMRHREERTMGNGGGGGEGALAADGSSDGDDALADGGSSDGDVGPRGSMRTALAGVGIALVYVTATTVIGFLSNLTSPVPPIREFGVVSAFGIAAALLVFGLLTPAIKVELDEFLEARGFDRRKRAFGTGGGRFSSALSLGSTAAKKAPYLVILGAVLLSAGGAYGATQVDTTFDQADFLAEDPPDWMEELPEPFKPSEYSAKQNLEYVNENFVREDSQAQILVRGAVAKPATLDRLAEARSLAAQKGVTQKLSTGEPDITGPLSVMRSVAASNETFNATFTAADTDGDRVPDRNVGAVYGALFDAAPDEAAKVLARDGDEYEAARVVISIRGGASGDAVTTQMRDVADAVAGNGLDATATGSKILNKIVQDKLLQTVIESLIITLVATFAFLMVAYRLTEGSATLGAVTLLPVAFSVAWILGTMYLLDIPFNVLTGMITSLTVGLGVAYSIHLSERYNQELDRTDDVWAAMDRTVTGTGGALLGSAATTVGGFGVLVFAILPPLQQFGLITGLTIIYACLASVLVLPSLLVVWTRYVGSATVEPPGEAGATAGDGSAEHTGTGDEPVERPGAGDGPAVAPEATRRLDRDVVAPGEAVTVTVRVDGAAGRTVLQDRTTGEVSSPEAHPAPVDVATAPNAVYAAWDDDPTRNGGGTATG